ncbi:MAG: DUF952 domain-containing protein [Bacteroidota bacterium]|jgi:uncharacterized protein (DUF952 family)
MESTSIIYHFASIEEWEAQLKNEEYFPSAYLQEGFIHCCTKNQLIGVLKRYFKSSDKVYLVSVDTKKIIAPLKFEQANNGDFFPHIYGKINKSAIVKSELIVVCNFILN